MNERTGAAPNIRILIVDDQTIVGAVLKYNIQQMNDKYDVSIATDGFEALDALRETPFDLVITDYMMPGMDGLELIETIRTLSPDTQIILISALKNKTLAKLMAEANVEHFLAKPFTSADIRQIVGKVLATVEVARRQSKVTPAPTTKTVINPKVDEHLRKLLHQTGAHCCFLVEIAGHLLAKVGGDQQMPLSTLASLAAANALATAEISRLLGNTDPFHTTIHEGEHYNVASYILSGGVLLIIVFDKRVKIGLIQHYARQAISQLTETLQAQVTAPEEAGFFNDDFAAAINDSLDELIQIK